VSSAVEQYRPSSMPYPSPKYLQTGLMQHGYENRTVIHIVDGTQARTVVSAPNCVLKRSILMNLREFAAMR
jgi:hypothetical protein